MNITPPFGYPEISALNKNQRVIFSESGETPAFCRELNALPISYTEFARVAHDYPIVFISSDNGETFGSVALLGLQQAQNLFIGSDGAWDKTVYVPAYARRYPFCMGKVKVDDVVQSERIVCVAKQAIDEVKGEALFDDKDEALPRWVEMEKLLREYEADLARSEEMCEILKQYDLFEPFSMQAVPNGGAAMQLTGMYRIAEARIESLSDEQLRNLVKTGVMGRIYTHLLSLDNFGRLLDRNVAAQKSKPVKAEKPVKKA
jgi:hypothetical protein